MRAIYVQDGDHVRAGQVLISLDPTTPAADQQKVARDLIQAQLDVARLTTLKNGRLSGEFAVPAGATPDDVAQNRASIRAQADAQAAKLADLDQQISQKGAEAAEVSSVIA